jgi:hypothetical protein
MKVSSFAGRKALAVLGTVGLVMVAAPAQASTDFDYTVNGSTHIASTGSNITLGPATLHAFAEAEGTIAADMALPGTRTEFKLLGFVPVTANVAFEPVGRTTGALTRVGRTQVLNTTSQYHVRLTNIKASIFPLFAGPFCRTEEPVTINAGTPAGEAFGLSAGGRLVGEYSIGDFQNCGLNTLLINSIIPGSGNTIELNLSDPVYIGG